MRTKLLGLELQRNNLLQKYTDNDRRVQDVEREIALLRQRLASEPNAEFFKASYSPNPAHAPLQLDLINAQTQLVTATLKADGLERDVQQRSPGSTRSAAPCTTASGSSGRSSCSRRTTSLRQQVRRGPDLRRDGQEPDHEHLGGRPGNLAPTPGVKGKSVGTLALMGAAFGLVLGVGGAFGREYFDHTFSTEESVRRR